MSEVKWIKISTDIFDNWKIKQIKAMPEGYKMVCIWFQLLCLCGKCNECGLIILSGRVVANDELLANIFGEDLKIIQMALKVFENFGMIEVTVEGVTKVSNWEEYQNADALERIREYERDKKAKQRGKKKELDMGKCPADCIAQSSDEDNSHSASAGKFFSPSKSNAANLDYFLSAYSEEYQQIINNQELLNAVKGWMEYKDCKKPKTANHYDSERGMRIFLNKVVSMSCTYGSEAVAKTINDSMSNNYQGVTWDKIVKVEKQRNSVFDEWWSA